MKKKDLVMYIVGLIFLISGILFKYAFNLGALYPYLFFIISFILIGHHLFIGCLNEFKEKNIFNEEILMIIAGVAALIIDEGLEANMLVILYTFAEILEDLAHERAEKSIEEMMNITVDEVTLIDGSIIKTKDAKIGDHIIVKAGELIPLDSIVIDGSSSLDTKKMTGEPIPKDIEKGSFALSGCLNLSGVITLEVKKELDDSESSKLKKLIEEAKEKKSKAESFVDKFSKIYTPLVIGLAIAIFFIEWLIVKISVSNALNYALTLLVISCPCAFVISVPLSFYTGLGRASKDAIMVRGSEYLEAMNNLSTIVFDKTGTLTSGDFKIDDILFSGISKEEGLKLIGTLESYSNHPIANVLSSEFKDYVSKDDITDIIEVAGLGIKAKYQEKDVYCGGSKVLSLYNLKPLKEYDLGTVVYLIYDSKVVIQVELRDNIREETYASIKYLREKNVRCYMLTGDKEGVANDVATSLSLDGYEAECLPENKIDHLKEFIKTKGKGNIAYIGDGLNDAPSLKLSDIGIAMGPDSSEAAKEAADVVILKNDLSLIKNLYKIAKFTHFIAFMNIIFALSIKFITMILVSLNLLSFLGSYIIIAGLLADTGVTLLCILNTIRIRKMKV